MVRTVCVAVVALAATALVAQTDPIKARKDLMEANGKQSKAGNDMVQGKQPFNLDAAKKIFASFQEAGEKAPALFPDTSKTGGKTAALPAIWENKADFDARLAKLASDSKEQSRQPRTSTPSRLSLRESPRVAGAAISSTVRRRPDYSNELRSDHTTAGFERSGWLKAL